MTIRCNVCQENKDVPCTQEQLDLWASGVLIQRAMPNVSPDDRELLISGICGPCFDKLFADDEDPVAERQQATTNTEEGEI